MDRLTPLVSFREQTYAIGLHQRVTVDTAALVEVLGEVDVHDQVMRGIDLVFVGI